MTVEMYSPVYGVIKFDGSQEARAVKFSVNIKHNLITSKRAGRKMPYKLSDGLEVTGTISRDMVDPAWLAAMITDTPTTGVAETLKTGVTLTADGATPMTITDLASPSRVRVTVADAAVTTGGAVDVVGADASNTPIAETLIFTDEAVGAYQTTQKLYKKVYYVYVRGIRSATGTLTVASIPGVASATPGTVQRTFTLTGEYSSGTNYVRITCNHCQFDSGSFNIQEGQPARDDLTWYMRGDSDEDLIIEGVNV